MFPQKALTGLGLLMAVSLSFAVSLRISGPLPAGADASGLQASYDSLFMLLKPGGPPDQDTLTLIFTAEPLDRDFGLPEWGGGGALGRDTIVVSARQRPFLEMSLLRVTLHEMVHIALKRAYPSAPLPRFMHEGLAMLLSGEVAMEEHVVVSKAIFSRSLLALGSIDSVNLFPRARADLAYGQSHLAVSFFTREYGMKTLPELLSAAEKEGSFDKGLYEAYGLTFPEAEKMIREDLIQRYRLVFLFADTYLFWVCTALMFLVAVAVVKIRNRRKMREMEENEGGQTP
jgi:hypothetical protein